MKELLIAIPTYNRAEKCANQVGQILNEISECGLKSKILLKVYDNHSEDETSDRILELYGDRVLLKRNVENLGLVGNYISIITEANTLAKYVWVVGDDDELDSGCISEIYGSIKNQEVSLVFLNHRVRLGYKGKIYKEYLYPAKITNDQEKVSLNFLMKRTHHGGFMWITGNILNTAHIQMALTLARGTYPKIERALSLPLFINTLITLQGGFKYVEVPVLTCVYGEHTWEREKSFLFKYELPFTIYKLWEYGIISYEVFKKEVNRSTMFNKKTKSPMQFNIWNYYVLFHYKLRILLKIISWTRS